MAFIGIVLVTILMMVAFFAVVGVVFSVKSIEKFLVVYVFSIFVSVGNLQSKTRESIFL